jgi:hypothetical protein
MFKSSTWRELCAVYKVLLALVKILRYQRVKWFSDNTGVCSIVSKGSMKPELQDLSFKIFKFCMENCIQLEIEWLPREKNDIADYFSKVIERDDWGISLHILDLIQCRWGNLEIDFFASKHNAKLDCFYSRFLCEGTSGVDAFTYNWGNVFGLFVPPIILIPRVLCKMQACRARGVLIVPEWKSASFWPLICSKNGLFQSFVIDYLILPSGKNFYQPCKNGSGLFGIGDLKFRMFALLIDPS